MHFAADVVEKTGTKKPPVFAKRPLEYFAQFDATSVASSGLLDFPLGGSVMVLLGFGFVASDLAVQFVSQFIHCGVEISV